MRVAGVAVTAVLTAVLDHILLLGTDWTVPPILVQHGGAEGPHLFLHFVRGRLISALYTQTNGHSLNIEMHRA